VSRGNTWLILGLIALIVVFKAAQRDPQQQHRSDERAARAVLELDQELRPGKTVEPKDGLAAAIAIDVSGSMDEKVAGRDGQKEPKIEIARRAALDLVDQFVSKIVVGRWALAAKSVRWRISRHSPRTSFEIEGPNMLSVRRRRCICHSAAIMPTSFGMSPNHVKLSARWRILLRLGKERTWS
jgi:hypothetical protein